MNSPRDKLTRAARHFVPALLAGFMLISCGGGGGDATTGGNSNTVTTPVLGSLTVAPADNAAKFTVFNTNQTSTPSASGSFSTAVVKDTQTYTFAVSDTGSKVYAAVNSSGDTTVTINAQSTAEAMVLLSPLLVPQTAVERTKIVAVVKTDPAVRSLATVIESVYGAVADPLSDTRIADSLNVAVKSVLTSWQASNTSAINPLPQAKHNGFPLVHLNSAAGGAAIFTSVDMGALTMANSGGTTLKLELNKVGLWGNTTNVDWLVRIVELDTTRLQLSPSGKFVLGDLTYVTDIDSLIKTDGYNQKFIIEGAIGSGAWKFVTDPLGSLEDAYGAPLFPVTGIPLPHDGVYAVIALSGSPFGDPAEFNSVMKSPWQASQAGDALRMNICAAAVDVVSAGTPFLTAATGAEMKIASLLKVECSVLKTVNSGDTSLAVKALVIQQTVDVAGKLIDVLKPIYYAAISDLQSAGLKKLLLLPFKAAMSAVDTWSGTISASSRILNFLNNVTPRESGYAVLGTFCNPPQVLTNGVCVTPTNATNGVCGASDRTTVSSVPSTNLCSVGTAGSVTGSGPWNWSCSGSDGGTNASCSAIKLTTTIPSLSITTSSLPAATVGTGYAQSVVASGGQTPYAWSVSGGQPSGLSINATTGSIYGTPNVAGTFSFTVTVTDNSSPKNTASQGLSLTVVQPTSTPPGNFTVTGTPYCETSHGTPTGAVLLEWGQSSTAISYDIIRDGATIATGVKELGARNTSSDLTGQTHTYVIRAHNSSTTTTDSNLGVAITVTVASNVCASLVAPTTPTSLNPGLTSSPGPTVGGSVVNLSWNAPSGATSYGGIREVGTGSDVVTINTSGTSATATLSPGKQYRWYVYACNSSGCSSSSALYYFQTPALALPCTVSFNTTNDSVDSNGAQRQVILTTSGSSCNWSATSNQSWVHNITPSSGTSGATLTYTVDANTSAQARSATIMAGQASLTISQVGTPASCTFSLGFTTRSITASGGTLAVGLTASNETCPRTAQSNSAFITDVNPASGNGTANIGFTVAANTSTSSRSGTLTIAGQTVTVNQDGAALPCTVSFNSTNDSVDSNGAQRQVILTTSGSSCTWSATSNQSWVHNITPSSGTAGATLTYTVDPNTSTQSRSATITAGQASLTISQVGTPVACTFSLGFTTRSITASGGTLAVGLTASNETCPRTAQSNSAFITNVNPPSGNGTANIGFTVAANTSTSPRIGTLSIAGQTVTVNQDGAIASPSNLTVGGIASSYSGTGQKTISLSGSGFNSITQISWSCTMPNGATICAGSPFVWAPGSARWSNVTITNDTVATVYPTFLVASDPAGTYSWSVTFSGGGQSVTKYFTVNK